MSALAARLPLVLGAPVVVLDGLELDPSDAPILLLVLSRSPMLNAYKPGQSIRFSVDASVSGVLTDPGVAPVLTVHYPDGSTSTPAVVRDSQGNYHGDAVIPMTSPPGLGTSRWQVTDGANVGDNALGEQTFEVQRLGF